MMLVWMWVACSSQPVGGQEALWMQSAYFDWDLFNHRVSALRFGFAGDDAELAVVGGTSTTNTPADLEDVCDPSTCFELPFEDRAFTEFGWGRLVADEAAIGVGAVALEVPPGGASGTVDIALPDVPAGEITALLAGFALDTDRALSGEPACYRPEYGWHPRRFAIAIDAVSVDEATNVGTVEVSAQFDPGPSFEDERACIDDVVERSVVGVTVDVVLLVGVDAVTTETVTSAADYPLGPGGRLDPDPQPEVAPLPLVADAPVLGWSSLDFAFDSGADGRGSYLRSLGVVLEDGGAAGIATNFSPRTQLTGFACTMPEKV